MEFSDVINTQYAFHGIIVGCVLAFAILVFVFGFKSAEEPPFDKLSNAHEDRKGTGKKKKFKDKKNQSNGHATAVVDSSGSGGAGGPKRSGDVKSLKKEHSGDKSPTKEQKKQEKKSPSKVALKESKLNKEEKAVGAGNNSDRKARGKENVEVKNKKNKVIDEKPKDFDDGEWEQALSKRDKKNRKTALEEILPQKSDKKKEKKKPKEEPEPKSEVSAEVTEEIADIKEKLVSEKSEPASVETSIEPVTDDAKPKKAKKKKQNSESSTTGAEDKSIAEEVIPLPKAQRQKKSTARCGHTTAADMPT
uniref:Putative microtubule-binding protein mip-t3 n=1 Tax=Panstrongylus lignarius TaxID=156445 RepID=A0A224XKM3_9HEMI